MSTSTVISSIKGCPQCGFHHQCICDEIPQIESPLSIALLMHENELQRETNTGRLLLQTLPNCSQYTWQRREPPLDLIAMLKQQATHAYVLFPSEHSIDVTTLKNTRANQNATNVTCTNDFKGSTIIDNSYEGNYIQPLFIILDATWQEARKMFRRSPWLKALPQVHLSSNVTSRYQLRRNQDDGHLCTCEVAIELLNQLGDPQSGDQLNRYFEHYLKVFKADKCGHKLKAD